MSRVSALRSSAADKKRMAFEELVRKKQQDMSSFHLGEFSLLNDDKMSN